MEERAFGGCRWIRTTVSARKRGYSPPQSTSLPCTQTGSGSGIRTHMRRGMSPAAEPFAYPAIVDWSGVRGSNPRQLAWKASALPSELTPRNDGRCPHSGCGSRSPCACERPNGALKAEAGPGVEPGYYLVCSQAHRRPARQPHWGERSPRGARRRGRKWWTEVESNHRPRAYQARALPLSYRSTCGGR